MHVALSPRHQRALLIIRSCASSREIAAYFAPLPSLRVIVRSDLSQGNVVFALPFVPGHAPLHATDILGLVFVLVGLLVYRFGHQLNPVVARVWCCEGRAANAIDARGWKGPINGSSASYALGEHRKPLLDLAEEDEEDGGGVGSGSGEFNEVQRRRGRGSGRRQEKAAPVHPKFVHTEWEM